MAKISKDHIEKFFDYDVDLDSRTIYMGSVSDGDDGEGSGVDYLMAERMIKGLHILDYNAPNGDKPITVLMNNPGGDVIHGMAIYDAIKNCKNRIIIKVYGYAMSMGSVILLAADEKLISANSKFMIHYGYDSSSNHAKVFEKWAKYSQKQNHELENLYLDAMIHRDEESEPGYMEKTLESILDKQNEGSIPQKPKAKVKLSTDKKKRREDLRAILTEMLNFDTILTAQETVDLGFADGIIGEN